MYRDWRPGEYPAGDMLPLDMEPVEEKQFTHGVGPGCTALMDNVIPTAHATPPLRIRSVCESLNIPDDPDTPEDEARTRCGMDSICSNDYVPAMRCVSGVFEQLAADD